MDSLRSKLWREIRKQERRQIREYRRLLREYEVVSDELDEYVAKLEKELQKQRRNVVGRFPGDEAEDRSIAVSDEYYDYLEAQNRADETMEETLRRLTGGPDPDVVAGILSEETATDIRERLEAKHETEIDGKDELRERFV